MFKDMCFCPYYRECKSGGGCPRALTQKVYEDAYEWWGSENAPICQLVSKPDCFIEKACYVKEV